MMQNKIPMLIYGTAGASKDAYYWTIAQNQQSENYYNIIGFVEKDETFIGKKVFGGLEVVTCDAQMKDFLSFYDKVAVLIPFGAPMLRKKIYENLKMYDSVTFPNIIHPSAVLMHGTMGQGNLIGPGVVFASEYNLSNFVYISIGASLGHDIILEDYVSINPGVTTAGNVKIKSGCYIGIGSTINQEITIAANVTVGAGAAVVNDINKEGITVVGIPAKEMIRKN